MTNKECISNLKRYKENPVNPTNNGYHYGGNGKTADEVDALKLQEFVDTMNKAIKIINKYEQMKQYEIQEQQRQKERELAELQRLKEKYE